MAIYEVILPKTGINVEEVYLLEWLAEEGTEVAVGDPVFQMETEKVDMEIPADDTGWLHHILSPSETPHPIGTVIGFIATTHDEYLQLAAGEAVQ